MRALQRKHGNIRKLVPGREACLVRLAVERRSTDGLEESYKSYMNFGLREPDNTRRVFYDEACLGLGLDAATLEPANHHNGSQRRTMPAVQGSNN
jgi:hypothetical protein